MAISDSAFAMLSLATTLAFVSAARAEFSVAPISCDVAVVGAGVGGAYSAWRLIVAGAVSGDRVCLFERSARVGGRAYSLHGVGPGKDFTLDVGAYRWCGKVRPPRKCDEASMPMVNGVIVDALKLPTRSYELGTDMLEIADHSGPGAVNAGYSVKADRMVNISMGKGMRWLPNHELLSISPVASGGFALHFANGVVFSATKVILNLPLLPLMSVVRASPALLALSNASAGPVLPRVLTVPHTYHHIKLYVYYDQAWWYTLNRTAGTFPGFHGDKGYPGNIFWQTDQQLPLYGRYHDGPVRCKNEAARTGCRGYLEAIYTSTGVKSGARVYNMLESFGPLVNSVLPYTHLTMGHNDANGTTS